MKSCPRCGKLLEHETAFCPHCGAQLHAQTMEGEVVDRDRPAAGRPPNPVIAAVLGVIPGLGHVYAGHPLRGLVFFAGVIGPEVLGTEMDLSVIGDVIGIPLNFGGLGLWAFSIVDAYRTARQAPGR